MTWQLLQDYKGKFELIEPVVKKAWCDSVLDIGCNAGAITNLFGDAGYFAVGIDRNVNCNGKHEKACVGQFKLDLDGIDKLPKFDAILLLSVLHQIIKEDGEEYAQFFVWALLRRCNVLIIELAAINSKYGYYQKFIDNNQPSIFRFLQEFIKESATVEFIGEAKHNGTNEPKRFIFKLVPK